MSGTLSSPGPPIRGEKRRQSRALAQPDSAPTDILAGRGPGEWGNSSPRPPDEANGVTLIASEWGRAPGRAKENLRTLRGLSLAGHSGHEGDLGGAGAFPQGEDVPLHQVPVAAGHALLQGAFHLLQR